MLSVPNKNKVFAFKFQSISMKRDKIKPTSSCKTLYIRRLQDHNYTTPRGGRLRYAQSAHVNFSLDAGQTSRYNPLLQASTRVETATRINKIDDREWGCGARLIHLFCPLESNPMTRPEQAPGAWVGPREPFNIFGGMFVTKATS